MTAKEFSEEFDILYNSVASNQAPSLDEYEKSVFLTKAQEELIRAYFNPKLNKILEGFGDTIYRNSVFNNLIYHALTLPYPAKVDISKYGYSSAGSVLQMANKYHYNIKLTDMYYAFAPNMFPSIYGEKFNKQDIMFLLNDWVQIITTEDSDVGILVTHIKDYPVIPINTSEYLLIQSRAYQYPPKRLIWRLDEYNDPMFITTNADQDFSRGMHLIFGPNKFDESTQSFIYHIKFIKKPKPIILVENLSSIGEDLSIDGVSMSTDINNPCELDISLHRDVIQRAVELAKSVYMGDINSLIAVGLISHTEIGVITSNDKRQ